MLSCYILSNNGLTTFSLEEIDFPTGSVQFKMYSMFSLKQELITFLNNLKLLQRG